MEFILKLKKKQIKQFKQLTLIYGNGTWEVKRVYFAWTVLKQTSNQVGLIVDNVIHNEKKTYIDFPQFTSVSHLKNKNLYAFYSKNQALNSHMLFFW